MRVLQIGQLLSIAAMTACGVEPSDVDAPLGSATQALDASAFGFAWYSGSVTPSSGYSANTGGGPITIVRSSVGQYQVTFGGLGGSGGNTQVVAYGTDSTRCKVESWFPSSGNELVNVLCDNPGGALADSNFVVRYGRATSSFPAAYLWADQPSATSYTPFATYNYNSTGGTNTITRAATGSYAVNLPGLGGGNGSVMVTAHGSSATHCNLAGWGSLPGTRTIQVRCWAPGGAPADSTFSLAFDGAGVTGYNDVGAFAWANDTSSASYTPSASYSYNSGLFACDTGANSAGKLATGRYFMRHTVIGASGSTVHVTARNGASVADYCKIEGWLPWSSNGVEVTTRCFDSSGTVKDAEYAESYYTFQIQGPC